MANMQSMNRTEALRLADALSQGRYLTTDAGNPIAEAAAELRRLHARIAELEAKASENYWLLYAMKEQELWYQDELVEEAKRTAAEKLRADQMTEQHRMQSAMNTEARGELAQLREKRQPLSDEEIIKAHAGLQSRLVAEQDELFRSRIGLTCTLCNKGAYQPSGNGYHEFHRCSACNYVPMWNADGTVFGLGVKTP